MSSFFSIKSPIAGTIAESQSIDLSFNKFFNNDPMLAGVPWRLISIHATFSATHINSTDSITLEPSLLQIGLNTAQLQNVENVVSKRFLVTNVPRSCNLRMPPPNLWKEDEQRNQSIVSMFNANLGTGTLGGQVYFLIHALFQFRNVPFTKPKSVPIVRSADRNDGYVMC